MPSEKRDPVDAIVVDVADDEHRVTINRGSLDGVKLDHRYLVYELGRDDIIDPESGESLGRLEIVKGTGIVIHVQERMSTIQSDRTAKSSSRRIVRRPSKAMQSLLSIAAGFPQEEEELQNLPPSELPFDSPKKGDHAKRVNA
ncbi:MAG: hypothetical protein IPG45_27920 [Deltaproteobacteria bacterium]|nr:hypothetical protein [Deltaproteobacteria bacterium]